MSEEHQYEQGLNLTAASTVFMMDPWWNPAGEEQAMDRVHRLGQKKKVRCVRFVIKVSSLSRPAQLRPQPTFSLNENFLFDRYQDSVEERMLRLQERKRCMIQVRRVPALQSVNCAGNLTFLIC